MISGIRRHTIRLGHRKFNRFIKIHGHDAVVEGWKHTTLLHLDFDMFKEQGFRNMFVALLSLQRFYPGITINTEITIVEYRILPF